jgi:Family of unknown function (DUF6526)
MTEQSYANHTKFFPLFHFFVLPILLGNVGVRIYWWFKVGLAPLQIFPVLVSVAILLGLISARIMALRVQDRVIRLEERLRLQRLLPTDLQARIVEFTPAQLVALRFACDVELPALARQVLDDKITDRKTIKQAIKNWRADYLRA